MKLIPLVIAVAVFAGTAAAAGTPVAWTKKDMTTAIRAIGYPKPHAKKLACAGLGMRDTAGRYTSFRCVATYTHHRRRVFYTAGIGEGGWLCAGKTAAGCKLLRRGFVTTAEVAVQSSLGGVADTAARGYLVDHDMFPYQVVHFCQQDGSAWSCPFTVNNQPVTVTISLAKAKGGYVVVGSTS